VPGPGKCESKDKVTKAEDLAYTSASTPVGTVLLQVLPPSVGHK
jgi:hypothetical protein